MPLYIRREFICSSVNFMLFVSFMTFGFRTSWGSWVCLRSSLKASFRSSAFQTFLMCSTQSLCMLVSGGNGCISEPAESLSRVLVRMYFLHVMVGLLGALSASGSRKC